MSSTLCYLPLVPAHRALLHSSCVTGRETAHLLAVAWTKRGLLFPPHPKTTAPPCSDNCVTLPALEPCDFITEETFGATDETRR